MGLSLMGIAADLYPNCLPPVGRVVVGWHRVRTTGSRFQAPAVPYACYAADSVQALLPTIGYTEIAALLVLGVVLFGRDLPDVGRRLGKVVANLRRGLHDFKRQLDQDDNLREIREDMQKTRRDIHSATAIPRGLKNPGGALRNLASEAMEPLPEEQGSEDSHVESEVESGMESGMESEVEPGVESEMESGPESEADLPPGTPRSDAAD